MQRNFTDITLPQRLTLTSSESPDRLLQFVQITAITQIQVSTLLFTIHTEDSVSDQICTQWHEQSTRLCTASHSLSPSQAMQIYLQTVMWATRFFQRDFHFFETRSRMLSISITSPMAAGGSLSGAQRCYLGGRRTARKPSICSSSENWVEEISLLRNLSTETPLPPGIDNRPGDDDGHSKCSEGWATERLGRCSLSCPWQLCYFFGETEKSAKDLTPLNSESTIPFRFSLTEGRWK